MAYDARVLVLIADGFRELVVLPCVATLREAGVKTMLVGLKPTVRGANGIAVTADVLLGAMTAEEGDSMVVIPGGASCARALLTDPRVHLLLQDTMAHGGEVAVLSGAERLVDEMVPGAADFRHQGKSRLDAFMHACVANLGRGRRAAENLS